MSKSTIYPNACWVVCCHLKMKKCTHLIPNLLSFMILFIVNSNINFLNCGFIHSSPSHYIKSVTKSYRILHQSVKQFPRPEIFCDSIFLSQVLFVLLTKNLFWIYCFPTTVEFTVSWPIFNTDHKMKTGAMCQRKWWTPEAEKDKDTGFPWESPKWEHSPSNTLNFAPRDLCQISDL